MRPERPARVPMVLSPTYAPEVGAADARLLAAQLDEEARTDVDVAELFGPAFLASHTGVADLSTLFRQAGLPPAGDVDRGFLHALGRGTLDEVAREHTDFGSWEEFEQAAARSYVARRMLDLVL